MDATQVSEFVASFTGGIETVLPTILSIFGVIIPAALAIFALKFGINWGMKLYKRVTG